MVANGRFLGRQSLSEVQWCLRTLISVGGYSDYHMAFGSDPVDPVARDDGDEDLPLA